MTGSEVAAALAGADGQAGETFGLWCVDVPAERWTAALLTARDERSLSFLDWLAGVEEPDGSFRVVVHLLDPDSMTHLLIRTRLPRDNPCLPTATGVYAGASWHERETAEMYGVRFVGHPDPRPLLLPDSFEGHPLRKDFVLAARVAKAWPGAKEPGESDQNPGRQDSGRRRRLRPPGVPDPGVWGPPA